jgi:hypothetical protein
MNWKDILTTIVFIILIAIVGGLFAYEYWWTPREKGKLPEEKIAEELPKPVEITEEYQSYYNEEYGYSISYPKNWKRIKIPISAESAEELEHGMFFYPETQEGKNVITVGILKGALTLKEVKERTEVKIKEEEGKLLELKEITFNNLKGSEVIILYEAENKKVKEITIPKGDKTYDIACLGELSFYDNYCDKIINSFSIEKPKPKEAILPEELPKIIEKEIANWQIFSEFGFSLRIPPDYSQKVFRKSETGLIADYRDSKEERILITYERMGKEATDLLKDIYRNFIQKAASLKGKTVKEIKEVLEEESLLHMILTSIFTENSELISAQEIKKVNCSAFALTFKTEEQKRRKSLEIIPSSNPDFIWGVIFFYNEGSETEILKIIQTIECKSS